MEVVNPFVQCRTDTIVTVTCTVLFGRSRWSDAFALLSASLSPPRNPLHQASLSARQNLGCRVPLPQPTYRDRPSGQYTNSSTPLPTVPVTEHVARQSQPSNWRVRSLRRRGIFPLDGASGRLANMGSRHRFVYDRTRPLLFPKFWFRPFFFSVPDNDVINIASFD